MSKAKPTSGAKNGQDYQPTILETTVSHAIDYATDLRMVQGLPSPSEVEKLSGPLGVYSSLRKRLARLQSIVDLVGRNTQTAETDLENAISTAIDSYAKVPFNQYAIDALRQFKQNFKKVIDSVSKGKVDGKEVKQAIRHVVSQYRDVPDGEFDSLYAYVATIPASEKVRELFLPRRKAKNYVPILGAFLAGVLLVKGCDYGAKLIENHYANVPNVAHKMQKHTVPPVGLPNFLAVPEVQDSQPTPEPKAEQAPVVTPQPATTPTVSEESAEPKAEQEPAQSSTQPNVDAPVSYPPAPWESK